MVVIASFSASAYVSFPPKGFSIGAYVAFFQDRAWVGAALTSLKLAFSSALISGVVGSYVAIFVSRRRFFGLAWVEWWFTAPLSVPHVALGLAFLVWYSSLGIVATFPGLLAGHVILTTPYVIRLVGSSVAGFNWQFMDAAATLGASPRRAMVTILLPMIRSGIIGGVLLAFIISFDDIVIALFLSGPETMTLPMRMYTYLDQSPGVIVAAAGSILVLFSLLVMAALQRVVGLGKVFGIDGRNDVRPGAPLG